MFDFNGTPISQEIALQTSPHQELAPKVIVDSNDNFIVVWADNNGSMFYNIYARSYDSTGNPNGDPFSISNTWRDQGDFSVAKNSKDEFMVVYATNRSSDPNGWADIFGRIFSTDGTQIGSEIPICEAKYAQIYPTVYADENNNFIVAWGDHRDGNAYYLYAKRFSRTGTVLGTEFRVTNSGNPQHWAAICANNKGNFIITWSEFRSGSSDIYGRMFSTFTGSPIGNDFDITPEQDWQGYEAIALSTDNNYIVAYQYYVTATGGFSGEVRARIINATTGALKGDEINIAVTNYSESAPAVAVDSYNNYVVAWNENVDEYGDLDIFARKVVHPYSKTGSVITDLFSPEYLHSWKGLKLTSEKQNTLNNQVLASCSIDGGLSWNNIPEDGSLRNISATADGIQFNITLQTSDAETTPVLSKIELSYFVNRLPEIISFPDDGFILKNQPAPLTVLATDPDGDELRYKWTVPVLYSIAIENSTSPGAKVFPSKSGQYSLNLNSD